MFSAVVSFPGGTVTLKAPTASKLSEQVKEKLRARRDWSTITYEGFEVNSPDLSLIMKVR